jgi:hypothetical protein
MRSQPPVLVTYYVETDDGEIYETQLRSDAVATAAKFVRQKREVVITAVESTAVSVQQVAA